MTGAAIVMVVVICLLWYLWQQRHHIRLDRRGTSDRRVLKPQQPHLERKLLKLLGGNRSTAERLIRQSQLKYPEKSADWHWEKAIYDLERDRWR